MKSRVRRERNPSGFVRLKVLLVVLALAGLGYVGSKLVPVYWSYLSMQDPVKEAAMAAARPGQEAEARADLIARAKSLGVALDEENVEIDREGNFVTVRATWQVPVDLRVYRRTLRFRVEQKSLTP